MSTRVLVVAPQPFYTERGTPIAVRALVGTLCAAGYRVDLLTYAEGEDITLDGLAIHRIADLRPLRGVAIGFSLKKLGCDLLLCVRLARLVLSGRYQVVHAVEEMVFPALLLRSVRRCRVVYDMDSSMAEQLMEKWGWLRRVGWLLEGAERIALRGADAVVAVCPYLADKARHAAPDTVVQVVEDVPLGADPPTGPVEDLRTVLGIDAPLALYVGNLEHYQGVDLLLEGLALVDAPVAPALVVIGGAEADIERYRARVHALGIAGRVHLLGPRPVAALGTYLGQADFLVSPRTRGGNTPMKIYSYLASGRATLATRIVSHTQALDDECALLVEATAPAMAEGLGRLAGDPALRERLGAAGRRRAESEYSVAAYRRKLLDVYGRVERGSRGPGWAP